MANEYDPARHPVPVIGGTDNDSRCEPTSCDVHLFEAPGTFSTNRLLLYADCEGLGGSDVDPLAKKAEEKIVPADPQKLQLTLTRLRYMINQYFNSLVHPNTARNMEPTKVIPERDLFALAALDYESQAHSTEISWSARVGRDSIVRTLIPRLLFTLSEIVVYVVRQHR